MQNKLSDAILGHPYAKFIDLELLQCKVDFCEIRLYETREGAWSLIMAEMRLQDWWTLGAQALPDLQPILLLKWAGTYCCHVAKTTC